MPDVLVALGTNVEDRWQNLKEAFACLEREFGLIRQSHVYETAPMYVTDQPAFLNAAARFETAEGPLSVLRALKRIEQEVGRQVRERYGPREIDLDLVGYGSLSYRFHDGDRTVLQVPHSRTPERRFVLAPLADIAPDFKLTGLGTVEDLLEQTNDQSRTVVRLEDAALSLQRHR